jgi:hypothetical protein
VKGRARCRMHGGSSTGPRTAEGLERCRRANWKHGRRGERSIYLRRLFKAAYRITREVLREQDRQVAHADSELVRALRERIGEAEQRQSQRSGGGAGDGRPRSGASTHRSKETPG